MEDRTIAVELAPTTDRSLDTLQSAPPAERTLDTRTLQFAPPADRILDTPTSTDRELDKSLPSVVPTPNKHRSLGDLFSDVVLKPAHRFIGGRFSAHHSTPDEAPIPTRRIPTYQLDEKYKVLEDVALKIGRDIPQTSFGIRARYEEAGGETTIRLQLNTLCRRGRFTEAFLTVMLVDQGTP
jgi:hypothetical protein